MTLLGQPVFPVPPTQPNIILIMADDFGYECVGANGGESYQTPHLDRLAATGMRFEQCHVQPLCTPTRVQLMTGMYNVRNYTGFGTIDQNVTTFAHLLKGGGYVTAVAGKWQLGQPRRLPQQLGFDESCLWQHTRRPARYANPGLEYNGEERDFNQGEYGPKLVNDFAIDFVTRNKNRPFFLYYPMILTHAPYVPTPDSTDWNPLTRDDIEGRDVRHFAEMVAYMDKMIGRLVAKLDKLGIRKNTLLLFLGDNGTGRNITSQFKGRPYRGGKGLTNARGTHVPLIVNWPARVSAGKVCRDLIDSTDFLPTLCEAAGVELPACLAIDGHSFFPQLVGKEGCPRQWIYCWYARNGGAKADVEFAMTATLKAYRNGEVFDLARDPFEEQPVSEDDLNKTQRNTVRTLIKVMGQFANARPAHLLTSSIVTQAGRNQRVERGQRLEKERFSIND